MLLIGPLTDAGDLGVINLDLVVQLIGAKRRAGADDGRDDKSGSEYREPHRTKSYPPALHLERTQPESCTKIHRTMNFLF